MHGRALEPLMCGPLLKRGKHLQQWKLRWYTLSVDGEFTCFRRRAEQDEGRAPMYTVQLSQLRITMLPPERLQAEVSTSGVFGFRLDGARGCRELFAETQEGFHLWINAFALLGACAGAAVGAADVPLAAARPSFGSDEHSPAAAALRGLSPLRHGGGSHRDEWHRWQ